MIGNNIVNKIIENSPQKNSKTDLQTEGRSKIPKVCLCLQKKDKKLLMV